MLYIINIIHLAAVSILFLFKCHVEQQNQCEYNLFNRDVFVHLKVKYHLADVLNFVTCPLKMQIRGHVYKPLSQHYIWGETLRKFQFGLWNNISTSMYICNGVCLLVHGLVYGTIQ